MATGDNISADKLGALAAYALNDARFRQAAANPNTIEQTLRSDRGLADALRNNAMTPLNDEEIAYCIGWSALAQVAFGSDDAKLVDALNQQAGDEGPGP